MVVYIRMGRISDSFVIGGTLELSLIEQAESWQGGWGWEEVPVEGIACVV